MADREVYVESRPLARLAVDTHVPSVLLDDTVDDRQPEPGPFSHLLGGEKRVEDPVPGGLVHTDAGVRHADYCVASGRTVPMGPHKGVVQQLEGGFYGE